MQQTGLPLNSLAIEPAINRHPLVVAPDILLADVLALMSRARSRCVLPNSNSTIEAAEENTNFDPLIRQLGLNEEAASDAAGCVLVVQEKQLVGIFTNRDIVRLTAAGTSLTNLTITDVLPKQLISLNQSTSHDIFTVIALFRQHRIRHLPIIADDGQIMGIVTQESIRKVLQPVNLLTRLRLVSNVMATQVVHAPLTTSVMGLAQIMAEQQVSCIVITDDLKICPDENLGSFGKIHKSESANFKNLKPVGIVTEGDIVQFRALELDLSRLQAQDVMSSPLFCLRPTDALWVVHEEMQQRHVRRLVVVGDSGELVGVVSQTSLLQVLNPADMYGVIEVLQQLVDERTSELKNSNKLLREEIIERKKAELALLESHNDLKRQVEERTAELAKANALLKKDILNRVAAETALRKSESQLREQATRLEQTLQELQKTQAQLIHTEKMSSLGQLVAGIAHEINNPINFIYGNIAYADQYIQDIVHLLQLYKNYYPEPVPEIQEVAEDIDLDFVTRDLPKLLSSMKLGADRIRDLVLSLRNFVRLDEAEMKYVNIHDGLESTLSILQNQLKAKPGRAEIQIIKEYAKLPSVECHAGQLNQVFLNILSNAIDALEIRYKSRVVRQLLTTSVQQAHGGGLETQMEMADGLPWIRISTEVLANNWIAIRIADNGSGMSEEICKRLFDPFFTTKPVGEGQGLGLSISYQIVTEKHGGQIRCISQPGQGAEFVIEIPIQQQNHSGSLAIA
ncbi:MAG TPA: CBS domain-containing protein [Oculatellaceae cyanobacterium]|jgi:signal transduction histidine kinase